MKKVSKVCLNESAEVLDKDEMKLIFGGGDTYVCICNNGDDNDVYFEFNHQEFWDMMANLQGPNPCYDLGFLHGGCSM